MLKFGLLLIPLLLLVGIWRHRVRERHDTTITMNDKRLAEFADTDRH